MRRFSTRIFVIIFICSIIITGANMIPVSAESVHFEIDPETFGTIEEETKSNSEVFHNDSEVGSEAEDRFVESTASEKETETEYITEYIKTDITTEVATEYISESTTESIEKDENITEETTVSVSVEIKEEKRHIDISKTAISPFAYLSDNNRKICEYIVGFVKDNLDTDVPCLVYYPEEPISYEDIEIIYNAFTYATGLYILDWGSVYGAISAKDGNSIYWWMYDEDFDHIVEIQPSGTGHIVITMEKARDIYRTYVLYKEYLEEVASSFFCGSEKNIANQVCDYLTANTKYNRDIAWANEFLKNKQGSCNITAITFRLLCQLCGVKCDVIVGYTESGGYHAWNCISLNGRRSYWDATIRRSSGGLRDFDSSGRSVIYTNRLPKKEEDKKHFIILSEEF